MKKIILWMAFIVSGVLCASEIYVGSRETKIITVPSGSEEVQSETVVVSSGARLVKDGEGALTLKTGALAQDFPVALEVLEGTLTLEGSTVEDRTFSGVSAILAKAALHLNASDEGSLVCNGNKVAEWLDTRETGSADLGYVYSRAVANTMAAHISELGLSEENLWPVKGTADGKSGVYFNGYKSGTWMNLVKNDGSQESLKLFNVFVVQSVEKGLGTLLGVNVRQNASFTPGNSSGQTSPLWQNPYPDVAGALASSRTCVNGAQIDPYNKGIPFGLCVIDVEMLATGALWENIFNDRGFTGLASAEIPDEAKPYFKTGASELRVGGEYIFEIVAFTNSLSAAERTKLAAYLREKWMGVTARPEISVKTAKAATVILDNVGDSPVSVSGSGTFKVMSGSAAMKRTVTYALASGETVTVCGGRDYEELQKSAIAMPVIFSGSADKGSAVVKGGGTLKVEGIASDIKQLSVREGELVLQAPRRDDSVVEAVVAGGNGSFEVDKDTYGQTQDIGDESLRGWHKVIDSGRDGSVFFYNQTKTGGKNTATWSIPNTTSAGDVVLGIKRDASVWTTIKIPMQGHYKVSFLASCRQLSSGVGYSCDIAIGKSVDNLSVVGVLAIPFHDGKYHPYEFMLPELDEGDYQLWFKSRNTGKDLCAVIDDIKVVVAGEGDFLKVPNGDFENFNPEKLPKFGEIYQYYNSNSGLYNCRESLRDWTLTQGDEYSASEYQGAVPVSRLTVTGGGNKETIGRFVELDGADDGLVQLYISAGCTASVTFTPPAGTYRLAASAALRLMDRFGSKDISLAASVTPDGSSAVDAGACSLKNVFRMKDCILPKPFSVDGQTAITLTIWPKLNSGTQGHLVIDNVRLVPELVSDGDFESSTSGWEVQSGSQGVAGAKHNYDHNTAAFGSDRASGSLFGKLQKDGSLYQDVNVVVPGLYRLSLLARTRQKVGDFGIDRFGRNPVAIDIINLDAQPMVTKRIDVFTPVYTSFTEFSWCVNIPKAGSWRLKFTGLSTEDRTTLIDDVSFRLESFISNAPKMPEDLEVSVSDGAKLRLDYVGTNCVGKIRLIGTSVSGIISSDAYPEYVLGDGLLYGHPKPFTITIR